MLQSNYPKPILLLNIITSSWYVWHQNHRDIRELRCATSVTLMLEIIKKKQMWVCAFVVCFEQLWGLCTLERITTRELRLRANRKGDFVAPKELWDGLQGGCSAVYRWHNSKGMIPLLCIGLDCGTARSFRSDDLRDLEETWGVKRSEMLWRHLTTAMKKNNTTLKSILHHTSSRWRDASTVKSPAAAGVMHRSDVYQHIWSNSIGERKYWC